MGVEEKNAHSLCYVKILAATLRRDGEKVRHGREIDTTYLLRKEKALPRMEVG